MAQVSGVNPPFTSSIQVVAPGATPLLTAASPPLPLRIESTKGSIPYFEFQDFEIPELLNAGGVQNVAVHEFPGGAKVVQSLGAFPPKLTWRGFFYGITQDGVSAFDRAQILDRLRTSGLNYIFSYGPWKWEGIITRLNLQIRFQWYVEYEIEVEVIREQTGNATTTSVTQSQESILLSVLNYVLSRANDPSNPLISLTYNNINLLTLATSAATAANQTLINNGGLLANVQPVTLNSILTSIKQSFIAYTYIISQLQTAQASTSSCFNSLMNISGIGGTISTIFTCDAVVSELTSISNSLQIMMNVFNSTGQMITKIQVINPNLFQMAAQYYGDPSLWRKIATANNLLDSQPTGQFLLQIPS